MARSARSCERAGTGPAYRRNSSPRGPAITWLIVTTVVACAVRRAGLGLIGAHRLRHSAATAMIRAGGSLTEIGQTLRYARPLTTALYAKVDVEALRQLARPWPGDSA
jgi:integrase/recombinase XerD